MAIKIVFSAGDTKVTAPSLHQWDYGQILEIESADLLPIVEVHFACSGMTEAIVRPCSVNNGLATVSIPDICLEQAGPISAWVFEINGTEGMTRKTITIPVTGRVKPAPGGTIPTEVYDRYTELISEMNEAVASVLAGNITVVQAKNANYAAEANNAHHAAEADTAKTTPNASWASRAAMLNVTNATSSTLTDTGLYLVKWRNATQAVLTDLIFVDNLTGSNTVATGGFDNEVGVVGPSYSAYSKAIFVPSGCAILKVWKIADYTPAVG